MGAILGIQCPDCIGRNLVRANSGLFDESSEERKSNYGSNKKLNLTGSDPLSDSLPDKNKMSKSEKSLKIGLNIF